jgi:hypothetical protein
VPWHADCIGRCVMYCACDHQLCFDQACRTWGCLICGAPPLDACEDCGEPVVLVRRLLICDGCMASYGTVALSETEATTEG